jgi:hypothetical protein
MARMLGAWSRPWCLVHNKPAGLDCPDSSRSRKAQRTIEKRQWRKEEC